MLILKKTTWSRQRM